MFVQDAVTWTFTRPDPASDSPSRWVLPDVRSQGTRKLAPGMLENAQIVHLA
jgi:hypothetical protein